MPKPNHYQTLEVNPKATQAEIKQAYRRLAKRFHPDSSSSEGDHERIISINAAYEILSNPQLRRSYDRQVFFRSSQPSSTERQQRSAAAHTHYQRQRKAERAAEVQLDFWMHEVYRPINRLISRILKPLDREIDRLAADPFDDQLLGDFQSYLTTCRDYLNQAQQTLASQPNPAQAAETAANLYYCLNQIGDGLDELEWFTLNYDEHYLHTGKELFRIAGGLRREAQEAADMVV